MTGRRLGSVKPLVQTRVAGAHWHTESSQISVLIRLNPSAGMARVGKNRQQFYWNCCVVWQDHSLIIVHTMNGTRGAGPQSDHLLLPFVVPVRKLLSS